MKLNDVGLLSLRMIVQKDMFAENLSYGTSGVCVVVGFVVFFLQSICACKNKERYHMFPSTEF